MHNKLFDDGIVTFKMGLNQFGDLTLEEFLKMNKLDEEIVDIPEEVPFNAVMFEVAENVEAPLSFDWRDHGVVSGVKNQQTCGCCYAIASVDSIESQIMMKTGKLLNLSVQEIIDCAGDYETFGCYGGIKHRVYDYIIDKKGLSLSADYPFEGVQSECKHSKFNQTPVHLKTYFYLPSNDEELLKHAVYKSGPISVSIDIDHESFMRYSSGVFNEPNCTTAPNHALLLVGYGRENGKDFWILKNSFGEKWGELGYMRIARNENLCGIASDSLYPLID